MNKHQSGVISKTLAIDEGSDSWSLPKSEKGSLQVIIGQYNSANGQ
jgi:hypothetical protein